jgi:hypothetical protein
LSKFDLAVLDLAPEPIPARPGLAQVLATQVWPVTLSALSTRTFQFYTE